MSSRDLCRIFAKGSGERSPGAVCFSGGHHGRQHLPDRHPCHRRRHRHPAFTGQTGQLRVEATSAGFLVQGETSGDRTADLVIHVAGVTAPLVGDFLL
jgi:hypothetical protein